MEVCPGVCGARRLLVSLLYWLLFVLETVSLELAILARLTGQQGLEILLSASSGAGITAVSLHPLSARYFKKFPFVSSL